MSLGLLRRSDLLPLRFNFVMLLSRMLWNFLRRDMACVVGLYDGKCGCLSIGCVFFRELLISYLVELDGIY